MSHHNDVLTRRGVFPVLGALLLGAMGVAGCGNDTPNKPAQVESTEQGKAATNAMADFMKKGGPAEKK